MHRCSEWNREQRTESEDRYRLLLDNLGEGVAYVDPSEIFTFGNPAADSIFGVGAGDLVGRSLLDFLTDEARTLIQQEAGLRRINVKSRFAHEIVRPNGDRRHLEVTATPQFHRDGRFLGTFAVFWDTTDRKRVQEELQETTKQHEHTSKMMELALEMGKAGAWSLDCETGDLLWNDAYVRLLGTSTVKTLDAFLAIVHPDDRKFIEADIQDSIRNPGRPFQNRFRAVLSRGVRWMERRGQVLCDASGKAVQMLGVTADVTEQKLAEDALRESEERHRTILKTAMDGFWLVDPHGRLLEVNDTYCRMCGYSREELLVMNVSDMVAQKVDDTVHRIKGVISHGQDRFELMLHRKDGSVFDAELSIKYQPADGGRLVAFVQDITDRKRADERTKHYLAELESARRRQEKDNAELERIVEQLAVEKERAEAATRAKSEFLSSMSHEIRTPMCGILGMTGLLLDTQLTEEQKCYADIVQTSGQALLDLINEILDFSKVEAGKLDLEIVSFDMRTVLEEVIDLLRARADEKGLELRLRYDPEAPSEFLGDPGRIRQVVLNLVGNAVKFTERGHVHVEVNRVAVSDSLVSMRISVSDTGIGIPAASQGRLFQQFQQVDTSATRRYGGTGLGLAISKRLVELMDGTLSMTSRVNEGSTFSVELPLSANPLARAEPKKGSWKEKVAPGAFAGRRVLLVEDNIVNQKLGVAQLGKIGCRVDVAANGKEALNMCNQLPYDLILMDCQMPIMDGYEATDEIRKREGVTRHTPVIALTAGAMAKDRERCIQAGMDDYLSKPFSLEQLSELFGKHLGPSGAQEPAR